MLENISLLTTIIFIIANIAFIAYSIYKFYKRKYFISIFNINIYIFAFALLFTSYFQFTKEAWGYLGVSNPSEYYKYLDRIIRINSIGFICFILTMLSIEFNKIKIKFNKNMSNKFSNISEKMESLNYKYVEMIFILCIFFWSGLILIVGQIPLFGNRLVFNSSEFRVLRPIYLLLNYMISIIGGYFTYRFVLEYKKKDAIYVIITIIALLFTGNRGPLMFLLLNAFIVFVYYKFNIIKANKLIVLSIFVVLILGVSMSFIRNKSFDISNLLNNLKVEIIYGNTFSDIRDGAYVLKGYEQKFDEYLYGKNYLADIISIIPSSISEFRSKWSYGSFSTETLFNMVDHYGLRGGWFLEPYINFGYLGVIIIAILNGYIFGLVEKRFWNMTIIERKDKFSENQIFMTFILFIFNSMFISSGFSNLYAYVGIVILYYIISKVDKKYKIVEYVNCKFK